MIIPTINIAASMREWLSNQSYSQVLVLCDANTERDCLPLIAGFYDDFFVVKPGEAHKNIDTVQQIWTWLLARKASRGAVLLNLGGGVIGDMGGFAAATYKRGIDFVQIPTTLLAMIDASIGGKLGIDFGNIKNSVGVFSDPKNVFLAPEFLATLPEREFKSGLAEVIKHELIGATEERSHVFARWHNLAEFRHLMLKINNETTNNEQQTTNNEQRSNEQETTNTEAQTTNNLLLNTLYWITENVAIKQNIVQQDPFEKGLRKVLNLGHTIGHALESFSLNTEKPLLHGEAVALGLIAELYLSHKLLGLKYNFYLNWKTIIEKNFEQSFSELGFVFTENDYEILWDFMLNDKKNNSKNGVLQEQEVKFSLLQKIGNPAWDIAVSKSDVFEALNVIRN